MKKKNDDNVQSKKKGKVQESIQSSFTPDPPSHFQTMNNTSAKIKKYQTKIVGGFAVSKYTLVALRMNKTLIST